jgi:hypothetical protein
MTIRTRPAVVLALSFAAVFAGRAAGQEVLGLIPRAAKPPRLDGRLTDWEGAFVTPVHVGHPDFANRGGQFLFLWDDYNLYIGLRCLDQKPAHVGRDDQIWNGDAVEFYLDTRRGDRLGQGRFTPGVLHMFWTPFTGTEVKPRLQVRDLPTLPAIKLQGAAVAAVKEPWGYTAEFKLPWAHLPDFKPKAGEVVGIDCELCSSDGGPRVDRTFVYSSPASVGTPAAFGRVRLVDRLDGMDLRPFSRALLPLSLTQSANYAWLYATACVSPTIQGRVTKIEGRVLDGDGKVKKTTPGTRQTLAGSGFVLWSGAWELFDLAPGTYRVEVTAFDKDNRPVVQRVMKLVHGDGATARTEQNPSPMVETTRAHVRLLQRTPAGRREKLSIGTLFIPEGLKAEGKLPLFVHFHGGTWLPEVAAEAVRAAVLTVQLGSGSAVYGKPFADGDAFGRLLREGEDRLGCRLEPVGLTAWSAGYGAVRAIMRDPRHYERVRFVVLLDGLHAGYVGGKPGPQRSQLVADDLAIFVQLARDAAAGKKHFLVVHSEIFPGTFASTTETADYLLDQLGLKRRAVLRWGPMQTQQLSEVHQAGFRLAGYAGNSAPDHVDLLHALPEFLKGMDWDGPAPADKRP